LLGRVAGDKGFLLKGKLEMFVDPLQYKALL
jgi:hypothetical protein